MALNAFLEMKGQKTGQVKGSVTQKGRENTIMVISASHALISPRDPQTGLPSGRTQHEPFIIFKEVDRSSPLLRAMLLNNENITGWTLKFWAPTVQAANGVGSEVQTHTVQLLNASIASIHAHMPNTRQPDTQRLNEYEEIAFTYQKITWTWNDGGITAEGDWKPV